MKISRLLALFVTIAWLAGARAQVTLAQQQQAPGVLSLAPAGGWTDTGLVVRQGDALIFNANPNAGDELSARVMSAYPPTYRMRIGDQVFPVDVPSEIVAPADGPLSVAVAFPRLPETRWPRVAMVVGHEPRPPDPPPDPPADNVMLGTDNTQIGNTQIGNATGIDGALGNEAGPDRAEVEPGNAAAAAAGPPEPPADDWRWPILPLAAGLAVVILLAAGLRWLRPGAAPPAAPPVVAISPSLDAGEGETSGDEIALAGPEIRLGATLEPGATHFDEGEPAIEEERRDG
jgi:hypothetical protein